MSRARADAWGECWRRSAARWEPLGRRIRKLTGWQVWNPGLYGESWHAPFRETYPPARRPILLLGLNPGPYGMGQTGVPFTDVKRLTGELPRLARRLAREGGAVELPGLAPRSLRPFLSRTFESSSVRVYRFLHKAFGDAERGMRHVVTANPCPLLFLDTDGKNRTPADLRRATGGSPAALRVIEETRRLRTRNADDALQTLDPAGVVMLGKDVERALGEHLVRRIGEDRVLAWPHPARAVPETWAAGLADESRRRGWIPRRAGERGLAGYRPLFDRR